MENEYRFGKAPESVPVPPGMEQYVEMGEEDYWRGAQEAYKQSSEADKRAMVEIKEKVDRIAENPVYKAAEFLYFYPQVAPTLTIIKTILVMGVLVLMGIYLVPGLIQAIIDQIRSCF